MFAIETFTAHADFAEDRIRLDAISPECETQSIFLTRRLSDRFVPLLVGAAESRVAMGLPKDIGLAMSQQQLRMEREANPLPNVEAKQGSRRWLCLTVHVGEDQGHVIWTLTDDGDNTAVMALPGDSVRSVLDVLLQIFEALEWSTQAFPAWMTTREDVGAASPRMLN